MLSAISDCIFWIVTIPEQIFEPHKSILSLGVYRCPANAIARVHPV